MQSASHTNDSYELVIFWESKTTQCKQCNTNRPHMCVVVVNVLFCGRNYELKYFVQLTLRSRVVESCLDWISVIAVNYYFP